MLSILFALFGFYLHFMRTFICIFWTFYLHFLHGPDNETPSVDLNKWPAWRLQRPQDLTKDNRSIEHLFNRLDNFNRYFFHSESTVCDNI